MKKFLNSFWVRIVIIPFFLFILLIAGYNQYAKTIPVSFWDEMIWVGQSYLFQYYIHGDFKNPVWQSYESYEEPQLANFAFGAWLYPEYLKEAKKAGKPFTYSQFLSNDGLYRGAFTLAGVQVFQAGDVGPPAFWVAKYGQKGAGAVQLIYDARRLNVFFLAGAALMVYFFVLYSFGIVPALVCTILYAFNPLLLLMGLQALAEGLFLFLFNASMVLMNLYFSTGKKVKYLILFSLTAGLCFSTKLNGMMLAAIFFIINTLLWIISDKKTILRLLSGFVPAIMSFIILIGLNPFTYSDPIGKVKYLFSWRMSFATGYLANTNKDTVLPDVFSRLRAIGVNFFSPEHVQYFSGNALFKQVTSVPFYNVLLGVLTVIGIAYLLKLCLKKNISAIVILSSFVIIIACMCYYLVLDWGRYYVHLPLFFVLFQVLGLYQIGRFVLLGIRYQQDARLTHAEKHRNSSRIKS